MMCHRQKNSIEMMAHSKYRTMSSITKDVQKVYYNLRTKGEFVQELYYNRDSKSCTEVVHYYLFCCSTSFHEIMYDVIQPTFYYKK